MAKRKQSRAAGTREPAADTGAEAIRYCSMPQVEEPALDAVRDPFRAALIRVHRTKWVNGTVLHYYFFDRDTDGEHVFLANGTREWRAWKGPKAQQDVVRDAFAKWKGVGVGLEFREVKKREEAEVRIGFQKGDGAWSYVGRDVLARGPNERTMNFGWDLRGEPDTALHEIGHTLGFPHEHQNPNAGIVWNEEAVYRALAAPPNSWTRDTTFHNIIRKISPDTVQGSTWDPNSIMHYPFGAGLIERPEQYRAGLEPEPGLSDRDIAWVKSFYPPLAADHPELKPFQSQNLSILAGEQKNFSIRPEATRKYQFRTFGVADTVIVLFEDDNGNMRYMSGDDDSGEDRNAYMEVKLFTGRRYVLRVRLYYAGQSADTAVMMW
jgi:hypothetical protein